MYWKKCLLTGDFSLFFLSFVFVKQTFNNLVSHPAMTEKECHVCILNYKRRKNKKLFFFNNQVASQNEEKMFLWCA